MRYLWLDRAEPNNGDGANDDCWNRALARIACDSDKSDGLTPSDTMDKARRWRDASRPKPVSAR